MGTTTGISSIPPELLDHVFQFLAEDRPAISSSRLVSRRFKACSSPYLITRVVLAKRLKEVKKLQEVLDHPYFSKHVTELVWVQPYDASYYVRNLAHDWIGYVSACENAPRFLQDHEWKHRRRQDEAQIGEILTHCGCEEALQAQRESQSMRGRMDSYYDHVYGLGCHKSLPDYNMMEKAQDRITAARVPRIMFERSLDRFINLKSVVFSDWRELGRSGESYDDCASRLFGNTLAPNVLGGDGDGYMYDLPFVLAAVANVPNIRSLSLGSKTLFGAVADRRATEGRTNHHECRPPSINVQNFEKIEALKPSFSPSPWIGLANITQLRFSLRPSLGSTEWAREDDHALNKLLCSMPNLTNLSLTIASPIHPGHPGFEDRIAKRLFTSLLGDMHFAKLHTLHLEHWILQPSLLQAHLEMHAATLRTLKLIHCKINGDLAELGKWAGTNLRLTGVDLEGVKTFRSVGTRNEDIWLASRLNCVAREPKAESVGFSGNGKEYTDDSERPWWTVRRAWR